MDYQQTTRNEQSSADSYSLKYLGLNLTKCTQDLYTENWRKRKKFRDPCKRRKDDSGCHFPCDWSADFFLDSDTLLLVCMGLQFLLRTAREVFRSESRGHCLQNLYWSRWSGLGVNAEAVSKEPGYTLPSRGVTWLTGEPTVEKEHHGGKPGIGVGKDKPCFRLYITQNPTQWFTVSQVGPWRWHPGRKHGGESPWLKTDRVLRQGYLIRMRVTGCKRENG